MPEGSCDPVGSPALEQVPARTCRPMERGTHSRAQQSRFAGRACDPVGYPRWSSLFLKDCTLWKAPTVGRFVKSCSPWKGIMLEKFVEDCLP